MKRFYLAPEVTDANGNRTPKYGDSTLSGCAWGQMPFGAEPWCLLGATVTQEQHDEVVKDAEVFAFPEKLDEAIADTKPLVDAIAHAGLPSDWLKPDMTSRKAIRAIAEMVLVLQRFRGRHLLKALTPPKILSSDATKETTLSALGTATKNDLLGAANDLGVLKVQPVDTDKIGEALAGAIGNFNGPIYLHRESF